MIGMKGMYLFPDMDIGRLIDSWTLWGDQWGHRPGMFDSIVYPTAFWNIAEINTDTRIHTHQTTWRKRCYMSTIKYSEAQLRIHVPNLCNHIKCEIQIFYLRSWNTTLIGDLNCSLYQFSSQLDIPLLKVDSLQKVRILSGIYVEGNLYHESATIQKMTSLCQIQGGNFEISCIKPDDRLSCIGSVSLVRLDSDIK